MILRTLFSEMPYGAALNNEYLPIRCSVCFVNADIPCPEGCQSVVYCGEKCLNADRSIHKIECEIFKKAGGSKDSDPFDRLLGRILVRRSIDGGVVNLCENFPKNVPDRRLSDLMSHQDDIEKNWYRNDTMANSLFAFGKFFEGTWLTDDMDLVRHMYCVMWINCFAVSGPLCMKLGHGPSEGLAFYLNVSRFNHSCRPSLHVHFAGSRLIMQYLSDVVDNDKAAVEERSSMTDSIDKFNGNTLSYGYSGSFSNDSYFPTRSQRRASLKFGYFFECRCELCNDEREASLEIDAAPIECNRCAEPFLWKRSDKRSNVFCCLKGGSQSKTALVKSCRCPTDKKENGEVKRFANIVFADEQLPILEEKFSTVMATRMQDLYAHEIVRMCEPVRRMAENYWHSEANLRMAQVNERLFVAYNVLVMSLASQKEPFEDRLLQLAMQTGESAIAWYKKASKRGPTYSYCTAVAAYALELAQLYELAAERDSTSREKIAAVKKWNRASDWYLEAASIWKVNGEEKTDEFVRELNAKAKKAKKSGVECEQSSS